MLARMKHLPLRHRLAHLRALVRQQPALSFRRQELARDVVRRDNGAEAFLAVCACARVAERMTQQDNRVINDFGTHQLRE
jgi:hypothetical protein